MNHNPESRIKILVKRIIAESRYKVAFSETNGGCIGGKPFPIYGERIESTLRKVLRCVRIQNLSK